MTHSDADPLFRSEKILKFLDTEKIKLSSTIGSKNQNQVSESINEKIKALVTKFLIEKDSKMLREWRKSVPTELKNLSINNKIRNKKYRILLFKSEYFRKKRFQAISIVISEYNKRDFTKDMSREEAEYYNTKTRPKTFDNSKDLDAAKIKKENAKSLKKVQKIIQSILDLNVSGEEKIIQIAELFMRPRQC